MAQMDPSREQQASPEPRLTVRTWLRLFLLFFILPAVVLFGAAGTLRWPMGWLFIGLSAASFVVSRLIVWRIHPDLLRERGRMMDHEDTARFDRLLVLLLALFCPLLMELVAGLALRFDWRPLFSPWLEWSGVFLYLLGAVIGTWALMANRFFSGVVRIQKERGHQVVRGGPYALIRHPGYLGAAISYGGMVLILGSPWTFIPFALLLVVLVTRTALEDRTLQSELPGYVQYSQDTRYRLLPGIW